MKCPLAMTSHGGTNRSRFNPVNAHEALSFTMHDHAITLNQLSHTVRSDEDRRTIKHQLNVMFLQLASHAKLHLEDGIEWQWAIPLEETKEEEKETRRKSFLSYLFGK